MIIQASHQLRFLREWAVFGRALRRSVWELLGVALALLLLVLAYSHTGHLVRISFFFCLFLLFLSCQASHTHTHTQTHTKHNVNLKIIHNAPAPILIQPTSLLTFYLCFCLVCSRKFYCHLCNFCKFLQWQRAEFSIHLAQTVYCIWLCCQTALLKDECNVFLRNVKSNV